MRTRSGTLRRLSTLLAARDLNRVVPRDHGFELLFRSEYDGVVDAVRWVVGSPSVAEELAQEAFCRALERWRTVSAHPNPAAWVRLTALRLAVRHFKRQRHAEELIPGWSQSSAQQPVDVDLQEAIAGLPRRQREAIVLHHLLDLSVKDTARTMGVSGGSVKTHLHRARARLAEELGETLQTPEELDDVTG